MAFMLIVLVVMVSENQIIPCHINHSDIYEKIRVEKLKFSAFVNLFPELTYFCDLLLTHCNYCKINFEKRQTIETNMTFYQSNVTSSFFAALMFALVRFLGTRYTFRKLHSPLCTLE